MPSRLLTLKDALAARAPRGLDDPGAKRAAVAAVLRDRGDQTELLLIRRADREGDAWSGHMAFPGGREEPSDKDLLDTAIRETREELGLDLITTASLLGPLDHITPRNRGGLIVAPYVFELHDRDISLAPNEEVAEHLWTPIEPLIRGEAAAHHEITWNGMKVKMPAYAVDGRIVWGMTYFVIAGMFALVTGD